MRLDAPQAIDTQQAARDLIKTLSDHYTETEGKGRILFTKDEATGNITGTDRSRGMWARMTTVASNSYAQAKADFTAMVRLAYPDHADMILSHMDRRQEGTKVTDMLTPGMIKAAYSKAQSLEALGWPAGARVATALARPNGAHPTRMEVSAAVCLIKDGAKPVLNLGNDHGLNAATKTAQSTQFDQARNFAACHDTAEQLQQVMGERATERIVGGGGADNRRAAAQSAIDALSSGTPCIIHLKATAGSGGHSFSLVAKPDGKVDVLEAWASSHADADLASLLPHTKRGLDKDVVIQALRDMVSDDLDTRTAGYTALSIAYDTAARFEMVRDPHRGPDGHETEDPVDLKDQDANINLHAQIRDLKPRQAVMDEMTTRLDQLQQFRQDLQFTPEEQQAIDDEVEQQRVAMENWRAQRDAQNV
ncbi:MAG TPA: hypothetical protein VEC19_07770 [Usitatibacter sp.]|nr:hypothetical protein [Usitatibacter sp.]